MDLESYISIVEKQEELLRFSRFGRKDAWELGQLMVSRILREKLVIAVSIRLANGFVLFQYAPDGTTLNNEDWMIRKFNVVRDLEISSLLNVLRFKKRNVTMESKGLDPKKYAASGGAFPIHVSGTGVVGAVLVSGLPHLMDHDFLIESISSFLKVTDVPRIPADADI